MLSKSSGRLMATGGDDCVVNIWSVNKPTCLMSLTGHTTPVESVKINTNEELIVAGSQSGSIRIWDLEAAKIFRTLMGHRANISSLDFHPFGDLVASGSMDTNIKLWDVRRKGCVFMYKGHTEAVRCLRFSPDGKWLASSADDHTVKLWDFIAGKIVFEFTGHTGFVNIVEFHPNKYLLALGSSDRTIRFWDLETFQVVSCIRSPVRSVLFNSHGCCFYAGCKNSLRVYSWEPACCYDNVLVNWGKVADLATCNSQLIGVSFTQSLVSSFVVDLNRVTKCDSDLHGLIRDDNPLSQPPPEGTFLPPIFGQQSTHIRPQRLINNSESERLHPSSENDPSVRSLFGNRCQGRFFTILSSNAHNPLKFWQVKDACIKFLTDKDIKSKVLEIKRSNDKETYLQCPPESWDILGVKLPVIGIFIKPLSKRVTLNIQILDEQNEYRWFHACSNYTTAYMSDFFSTVYMDLKSKWNLICYNLFDHIKGTYRTSYKETTQVQVCGSCQLHTIFFSDRVYDKQILLEELHLPIPSDKANTRSQKH